MQKAVGTNMITHEHNCANCYKATTNEMIINTISFTMCEACEEKINASFAAKREEEEEYGSIK